MSEIEKQRKVDEMRRRLYERGSGDFSIERHTLTDDQIEVSRNWQSNAPTAPQVHDLRTGVTAVHPAETDVAVVGSAPRQRRRYRAFILLGSVLLFVVVAAVSSFYLYLGGNQISGDNIAVEVSGPASVGGGEQLPLQITVANNNSVAIEAATLIVKYPPGTLSIDQPPRSLYEERIAIENIQPGEVRNVSVNAALYGDVNSRQEINATLEYRIQNSNSTFYKDANTFAVLIGSAPLVLRVQNVEKVASGQFADVTIAVVSNSATPLNNILIAAEYPNSFTYRSSNPEPVFNTNVWRVDKLLPEQTVEIKIRGVVVGLNDERLRINFKAGPANQDNQYTIGSVLADSGVEFLIERPFIALDVSIGNTDDEVAVLDISKQVGVTVDIQNTLDETVYDMVVEVVPDGNAVSAQSIVTQNGGFYDSNKNAVRWEVSNYRNFAQVLPGAERSLSFTVLPDSKKRGASFGVTVNVYARRVAETSATEELLGSVRTEAKFNSIVTNGAQASRNGVFADTGPVPPQVGQNTTYTVTLVARAGVNDTNGGIMETALPIYVDWLDSYVGDGEVVYNTVSKKLQWQVGAIAAGQEKQMRFQVGIVPSTSQVGDIITLINTQNFRTNDDFTGGLLQSSGPAITTELSPEYGFAEGNGRVVQ